MNNDRIKEIALQAGFKLKEQPDGGMDLNPYVYTFARNLLDERASLPVAESVDTPELYALMDDCSRKWVPGIFGAQYYNQVIDHLNAHVAVAAEKAREEMKADRDNYKDRSSVLINELDEMRQRAEADVKPSQRLPIILELPEGDPRTAKVAYATVKNGKQHICITVSESSQQDGFDRDTVLSAMRQIREHCRYNETTEAYHLADSFLGSNRPQPSQQDGGALSEQALALALEQAAQACDQRADGTNGPYRSACLQCANDVRELRDAAIRTLAQQSDKLQQASTDSARLNQALWFDLKTDADRSNWLLMGRGYETGVVAASIQNDLAMAYHKLQLLQQGGIVAAFIAVP